MQKYPQLGHRDTLHQIIDASTIFDRTPALSAQTHSVNAIEL